MNKKIKRCLFLIIIAVSLFCISFITKSIVNIHSTFYKINVAKETTLYIPVNATFRDVLDSLRTNSSLVDITTFYNAAQRENYIPRIRSGRYKLKSGMTNKQLVRKLKTGAQDPVNIVISGSIRTNERLAAVLSRTIAADSVAIFNALSNEELAQRFDYKPSTIIGMIVPNTYQVYWDILPEKLLQRLYQEYSKFWNEVRIEQLKSINLTREEAITLASIVNEETNRKNEMPRVAGVYMNRLRINMPLQADPTLIYANKDYSIRRVLDRHKNITSPYNTYLYTGLPPGAICVPSIASIDAVLNYEHHNYFYFCAKDDFSGELVFAASLPQHNHNAIQYRNALNKNKIFK